MVEPQKKFEPFCDMKFPDGFRGFAATVYKDKGYIVVSTAKGYLSIREIGSETAILEVETIVGNDDRLTTSKDGRFLAQLIDRKKVKVWDLGNGIETRNTSGFRMLGEISLSADCSQVICRTNRAEEDAPWLFLRSNDQVEIWAYQSMRFQPKIPFGSGVKSLAVPDSVVGGSNPEVFILAQSSAGSTQLQYYDTLGSHLKTIDMGNNQLFESGVSCNITGKLITVWMNEKGFLLDWSGKKKDIKMLTDATWFTDNERDEDFLLTMQGLDIYYRPFNRQDFDIGAGYSIEEWKGNPRISNSINVIMVNQDLYFFELENNDGKKILVDRLADAWNIQGTKGLPN